jgi:PPM family protein phosphatase
MSAQTIALTLFGRTQVGKTRASNEDSFLIADLTNDSPLPGMTSPVAVELGERGVLIAVSDGMGGARSGEVASALVLSALRDGLSTIQAPTADVALTVSVEGANRHVFETAQATGRAGMGATLTAVLFHGVFAYIAEIGDSRAYLLRDGQVTQLTHDQSYVQTLVDSGVLSPEQADASELKNVILQAMGISPTVAVALSRLSLRRGDRFLVCSDGLSGSLEERDILDGAFGGASLESACAKLVETAVAHGSEDDITVLLAEVQGEGVPAATTGEPPSLQEPLAFDATQRVEAGEAAA